ncbi:hypothetical protein HY970_03675 [Candidatus Kaiserbacteria bacterium]|nr:hypothetical protein [Candidatus Kaiserbacteria bacterium]
MRTILATILVALSTNAHGHLNSADPTALPSLSPQQRSAAMQPLVRSATECIARKVALDPRAQDQNGNIGDLIVASMPACVDAVRAMIDAHDRYFGDGTGEAFFMGPYLDVLPRAVGQYVKQKGEAGP